MGLSAWIQRCAELFCKPTARTLTFYGSPTHLFICDTHVATSSKRKDTQNDRPFCLTSSTTRADRVDLSSRRNHNLCRFRSPSRRSPRPPSTTTATQRAATTTTSAFATARGTRGPLRNPSPEPSTAPSVATRVGRCRPFSTGPRKFGTKGKCS